MEHQSHVDIAKRLKRANGHLAKVIDMIESGRPCVELAQQLHAVERAVANAKSTLIHDHVEHCLAHAAETPTQRAAHLQEFRDITRYL